MELKKWIFDFDIYDDEYLVVFAENLEEALKIVNLEEWDNENECSLDDYYVFEQEINEPSKAYKGCYVKENFAWYDC